MPFPYNPDQNELDERGLFLVQDPALRARILPLFDFDPLRPEHRPIGHGTTFRIDPWGGCATAFHVVEDMLSINDTGDTIMLLPDRRLVALELNGITYGHVPVPVDAWRPLAGMNVQCAVDNQPFQNPILRNLSELASLEIHPSGDGNTPAQYFPLDLTHWQPKVGEAVMAFGFAGLDLDKHGHGEDRPLQQYIYGSIGSITDIEPANGDRRSPWPMIRVEAEWPGGMSGGPVFNERGLVIGLVSSGIEGQGVATATYFSGWDIPARILRTIEPHNAGWFRCYGVFDNMGQLITTGPEEEPLVQFAIKYGHGGVKPISHRFGTDDCLSRAVSDGQYDDLKFSKPLHPK
ncbi:S1 family peptidase [Sulfitobacter sp.]|uniref:S1 family peptidase n=1 Tax=Sulfitobacter sp. TaxID=1903071 RepID=UPI0030028D9D